VKFFYLCNKSIGSLETGFDSHRRFIGELDGSLEQIDRELWMFL
jgi:hypothetical protein